MDQQLKRNKPKDNSVTIEGNVRINGDGVIGNENKIVKKSFNKKDIGIFAIIGFIAAVITIYAFFFQ